MGVPPNHPFIDGSSIRNHLFWGIPFMESPIIAHCLGLDGSWLDLNLGVASWSMFKTKETPNWSFLKMFVGSPRFTKIYLLFWGPHNIDLALFWET